MANSPGGVYGRPRKPDGEEPDGAESAPESQPRRTTGRASVGGSRPDRTRPDGSRPGASSGRPKVNGTGGTYGAAVKPKRNIKPRWGRIALVATGLVLVLALLIGGGLWIYGKNLDSKLKKTDPFSAIVGNRPLKTVDGALNILLVGSDSRDPDTDMSKPGEWRSDTIVMVHVSADHEHVYLVSIPRDLYVYVPKMEGAIYSDRYAKINAAFAWGWWARDRTLFKRSPTSPRSSWGTWV